MLRRYPITSGPLLSLVSSILVINGWIELSASQEARPIPEDEPVDFSREVLPILSDKCFVCHGPDAPEADQMVRLDSFEGAIEDRGGYHAIDPDHPADSELLARINSDSDPMPPFDAEKELTDREREILNRWVLQGGEYASHWAFVSPQQRMPESAGELSNVDDWDPIDILIGEQLKDAGIDFADEADRPTLARRAALILTGLPPESDWLDEYLADDGPDAYANYVDRLLSSERFGEHQARYWLDAVRYGDTHGLHLDNRRGIYPYRDWVIRAFNQNLPLDQFIKWQIAGDLLPDPSLEQLVATGFVRMNPSTAEGGAIAAEFQAKNNFDRVETLGTVLLGMTFTCARCHTHKYDPITQNEYYGLLAFFNSTAEHSMDGNAYEYGPTARTPQNLSQWDAWDLHVSKQRELIQQGDQLVQSSRREQVIAAWTESSQSERWSLILAASDDSPLATLKSDATTIEDEYQQLQAEFTTTLVAQELDTPRETFLLHRGEYTDPKGDPLSPSVPAVMSAGFQSASETHTDRRDLASWLVSPENPLVARVLVNRIWQRTFGDAIVRSPEDFGLQGQQPTHPFLLDWLAVDLHESGWDLKAMLRRMVLSRTFRQSSRWRDEIDDPENRLFARGPRFRLDAEVIRDIGLWASDLLANERGGEGIKPYQPPGMWLAMAHPGSNTKQYVQDNGDRLYRRSIYVYWKRTSPHPMMTLFDAPDRESSCVRRSRTNTALQSLALLNETQRIEMARKFAECVLQEGQTETERLNYLIRLLTCREPNSIERDACLNLLHDLEQRYRSNPEDALALLEIGEAPRNEELDAVDHAAWTQVIVTVLASDLSLLVY